MSGYFEKRGTKNLVSHSGFILIDIDDLEDIPAALKVLKKDKFSYAIFKSVSGNGLGVLIKIDPAKHTESFSSIEAYYSFKYQLTADTACKDVSRTRYVSYDPDTYINKKADKFIDIIEPAKEVKEFNRLDTGLIKSEIERAVIYLKEKDIDITEGYNNWLITALSLSSTLGEDGRKLFHDISSISKSYSQEECEEKFSNCMETGNGSVTIGSLFYILNEAGFKASAEVRKQNDTQKVIDYLNKTYDIRNNEVSRIIECKPKDSDSEYKSINVDDIYIRLKTLGYKVTLIDLKSMIRSEFIAESYHPIKDYFKGLEWNGGGHIDELCNHFSTDNNERFAVQLKKMLVRSIACAIEEDTFNKHCLVLHSTKQNLGKTTFWRWLSPPTFRRRYYFEGHLDPQNKDSVEVLF
jgi:hypothetical protein